MDRRDTLKTLLIGGVAAGAILQTGCKDDKPNIEQPENAWPVKYGRTPEEQARDEKLLAEESVFTTAELETIAILCDIILPATATAGSASDAEVPAFIDFIVKDIPNHQLPLKGGLMWLDAESNKRFGQVFKDVSPTEQIQIVDDIAYPDDAAPEMKYGVIFFNRMRNLTLTGYYTSKMGIKDLGYQGNTPNVWDGIPQEVLNKHDVDYDPEWIAKCVDQSKRDEIAVWDDEGNLIS